MKRPKPDGRVRVVPSLLAADHGALRADLARLVSAGARWASVDVMDGHFVPNLSFGPGLMGALRQGGPDVALDAHLMVAEPERYAPIFAAGGADWVTWHLEACPRPRALLKRVKRLGVGVGLAVRPATPAEALLPYLGEIDLALVMSVEPGFGGQRFLPRALAKLRVLRAAIERRSLKVWIQVDGGIQEETAPLAAAAGADSLVAGSALLRASDPAAAYRRLTTLAQEAYAAARKRSLGGDLK